MISSKKIFFQVISFLSMASRKIHRQGSFMVDIGSLGALKLEKTAHMAI
jgi:hypothetical protein